jgi:hypothetical protein
LKTVMSTERSRPFIGSYVTFHVAHPTVESATVRFTETDFGDDPKLRYWNLADSPRISCRNSACQRGGYNIEWLVGNMIENQIESKEIKMSCDGDEGTPKGRKIGRNCGMSIEGTISVKYKVHGAAK